MPTPMQILKDRIEKDITSINKALDNRCISTESVLRAKLNTHKKILKIIDSEMIQAEKEFVKRISKKMQVIRDVDCDMNVTFIFSPETYYNDNFKTDNDV